jgi:hypothetical protein
MLQQATAAAAALWHWQLMDSLHDYSTADADMVKRGP